MFSPSRCARNKASIRRLPDTTLTVVETPYSVTNGAEAMQQLLDSATPPSAVICAHDVLATGALRMTRQIGLSVPGDISVTGFNDIGIADIVTPALTSVHVPHRQMGREAARKLVAIRNGKAKGNSIELGAPLTSRLNSQAGLTQIKAVHPLTTYI